MSQRQTQKLIRYEIIGFFLCILLSVLFHFTYEWTGHSPWVAFFVPVNESIWEHTKLAVLPYLLWSLVEWLVLRPPNARFLTAKTIALYTMVAGIILLYYTYTGIWGESVAWINIAIQVILFAVGILVFLRIYRTPWAEKWWLLSAVWLVLLLVMYVSFTNSPPLWNLFRDPQTGQFGTMVQPTFSKIPV